MKDTLRASVDQLGALLRVFPWAQREAYADWLAQTYYHVRHATRLLATAAARFPHDTLGDRLHVRFTAHMAEGKRHELLALHDLKALGGALESFVEHGATRMLYEPQYYKIEHHAPESLFGYVLFLETLSVEHAPWILDRLHESHAEPCTSFVQLRAADDIEHLERAFLVLAEAPQHHARIAENMRQSALAYATMLHEIIRATGGRPRLRAALD